jgi:hypothetical protein
MLRQAAQYLVGIGLPSAVLVVVSQREPHLESTNRRTRRTFDPPCSDSDHSVSSRSHEHTPVSNPSFRRDVCYCKPIDLRTPTVFLQASRSVQLDFPVEQVLKEADRLELRFLSLRTSTYVRKHPVDAVRL